MARALQKPGLFAALAVTTALVIAGALTLMSTPVKAADLPNGGIHTITQDEAKLRALLEQSGWVSPGLSQTRFVYMVSFRSCPDCIRFETEQFPDLHRAGIDTRVIVVARRAKSTQAERSGVAELWARRDWKTYETWTGMPVQAWTAEGLINADLDAGRAGEVEKGRELVEQLRPLMAENGISFAYPLLIWQDKDGHLRGCACEDRITYPFVRAELGLPNG